MLWGAFSMRKCKLTNQERITAVKEYLNGHGDYQTIAKKYGIDRTILSETINIYLNQGEHALYSTTKNTHDPPKLKRQAADAYFQAKAANRIFVIDFIFAPRTQLHDWIKLYNGQDRNTGQSQNNNIERTYWNRQFCIEHGKDDSLTIQQYGVSYNHIYSWVHKYESAGVKSLTDKRRRKKPKLKMDETEQLKAESQLLKTENRQ